MSRNARFKVETFKIEVGILNFNLGILNLKTWKL